MRAYYNEIEPYAVQWILNLANAGHITDGIVDSASVVEVEPANLAGYERCHFFAGLGGWDYALRLAGWRGPVWTGSCPCQPFSTAGLGRGLDDERHLWPAWFKLIKKCRPPVVFGEQVASPDGLKWLDVVRADLEGEGYAFGAADLCAAGVGAPHIRQRLYFVAVSGGERREGLGVHLRERGPRASEPEAVGSGAARIVEHPHAERTGRDPRGVPSAQGSSTSQGQEAGREPHSTEHAGAARIVGHHHHHHQRLEGHPGHGEDLRGAQQGGPAPTTGFWSPAEWLPCDDGKARPVEPGTFPLAHGVPNRVGRVRAYGNAIVPQVAATFIRAVMESM